MVAHPQPPVHFRDYKITQSLNLLSLLQPRAAGWHAPGLVLEPKAQAQLYGHRRLQISSADGCLLRLASCHHWGRNHQPHDAAKRCLLQQQRQPDRNCHSGYQREHSVYRLHCSSPPYFPPAPPLASSNCASSPSALPLISTWSPTRATVNSSSTSAVAMRMQPCEAAAPMDCGSLVPWIP